MFKRRRGQIRLALVAEEIDVLRGVIADYLALLEAGRTRTDPVIARLFPSASLDDALVAADYRELAESDLDQHKRATAALALESLGALRDDPRATLTGEEQEAWLVLLTDLRLAMGVRLEVTEESLDIPPDPADPEQWPLAVYLYLGSLQDSLVTALQPDLPRPTRAEPV